MTDANGARNINPSDTSSGSFTPSRSGSGSSNPNGASSNDVDSTASNRNSYRSAIGRPTARPKLNSPSSRILSQDSSEKSESRTSKASTDAPRTRYRANSTKPARRSRRTRNSIQNKIQNATQKDAQSTSRRRLFGAAPDRVKRKSSSRTRALKARIPFACREKVGKRPQASTVILFWRRFLWTNIFRKGVFRHNRVISTERC